jgi:hypothetical protein
VFAQTFGKIRIAEIDPNPPPDFKNWWWNSLRVARCELRGKRTLEVYFVQKFLIPLPRKPATRNRGTCNEFSPSLDGGFGLNTLCCKIMIFEVYL